MNALRLSFAKFWILFISEVRFDTKAYFSFWGRYLWIFFLCLNYRFFLESALSRAMISLGNYEMSFPLFLISGIAVFRLVILSIGSINETIFNLRRSGVISWILLGPTNIYELFFAHAIWKSFLGFTEILAAVIFSNLLIGTPIQPFFQISSFCALLLMSFTYIGIGMSIAAVSLLLRKGDFLCLAVEQISMVFGGMFFPIYLLPKPIVFISQILPITHSLNIIRYSLTHIARMPPLALFSPLIQMSLVYFVLGIFILQKSLTYAKQNGLLLNNLHE